MEFRIPFTNKGFVVRIFDVNSVSREISARNKTLNGLLADDLLEKME